MKTNRTIIAVLFLLSGTLGMYCYVSSPAQSDGITHVYMLNIGQGDSFLIEAANGNTLLIDGGKDSTVLTELSKVMPLGDTSIDVMIATHPDADHIGGLSHVLERYHVGLFLTSQVTTDTKTFTDLYKELYEQHIPSYYVRQGMVLTLDTSTTFTVLFPDRDTSGWKTNEASIVGKVQVGTRSMLFTGDSPSSVEHFLIQAYHNTLASDVLKLGHHGSKYSSSTEYLQAVHPTLGLVSAGVGNSYGHPNPETLDRMKALDFPWVSTQDKGTVELSTDGTKQWSWESIE